MDPYSLFNTRAVIQESERLKVELRRMRELLIVVEDRFEAISMHVGPTARESLSLDKIRDRINQFLTQPRV